jgi:hypothetical protein
VQYAYEQLEQLDEPQFAQEEPEPVDDDLNLCPVENPKEDIFLVGFLAPHAGHSGFSSLLKTSTSNSFPHFLQIYSYIGIVNAPWLISFFSLSLSRGRK